MTRERRERDNSKLKLILTQIALYLAQRAFWHNAKSLVLEKSGISPTNTLQSLLTSLPTPPKKGWDSVKLGDSAEVIAGQSPESKFYNDKKEGLLFFQGKKDFGEIYLNHSNIWTSQITKESFKDDILMSVRAPVGDVNINPFEKICIGRGLAAIRAKNYKFLFLCLHYNKHLFVGRQGMTFESITTQTIIDTKIPLPPLESQEKIVSVIENIESKITNLDSTCKLLESQKTIILKSHLCG